MAIHTFFEADDKATLYGIIPPDGFGFFLVGDSTRGDLIPQLWVYDSASIATDDFSAGVIKPTAVSGAGRYLRMGRCNVQADWAETDADMPSFIQNKPVIPDSPLESAITPTVNTPTQASNTARNATINVSMSISVASTLLGTNSGTVFLEISADGSTNWLLRGQIGNSVQGVASTIIATHFLSGFLPAGWYYRLRTAMSGTNGATFAVLAGQEILL